MTRPPSAKVLCGKCDRLLGRVIDTGHGLDYKPAWRGTANGPGGMWCPAGHGWPDLSGLRLRPGKAVTHRAEMLPYVPRPL
jgi:hypothetical protein